MICCFLPAQSSRTRARIRHFWIRTSFCGVEPRVDDLLLEHLALCLRRRDRDRAVHRLQLRRLPLPRQLRVEPLELVMLVRERFVAWVDAEDLEVHRRAAVFGAHAAR
jgi:hypothetical protein